MISYQYNTNANLVAELLKKMEAHLPGFMVKFSSSVKPKVSIHGSKIVMPTQEVFTESHLRSFKMLAWAYVFCTDKAERPFVHWLFWWFPFYFASLSFLSVLSIWFGEWFLLSLVSLFFLFLRRRQKQHLLARAYAAVVAINIWRHGGLLDVTRDWIVDSLSGFRKMKKSEALRVVNDYEALSRAVDAIKQENILDYSIAFVDIYEILTDIELEE